MAEEVTYKYGNRVTHYGDAMAPYIKLIEAIILSGKACNDTAFLESSWYRYLNSWYVQLWQDYSKKNSTQDLNVTIHRG